MAILYVGIDLAKNVFAVHGVDEAGKPALVRPSAGRAKVHELIAAVPPCTVAMEACSGAHHWARLFAARGHTVRLIAEFVTPYRMSGARGKTDAACHRPAYTGHFGVGINRPPCGRRGWRRSRHKPASAESA